MTIDMNLVRGILTAILFLAFCLMVFWVYHPRKKQDFEAMGRSLIDDDNAGDSSNTGKTS